MLVVTKLHICEGFIALCFDRYQSLIDTLSQHFMLGHHRHVSETRADDVPLIVVFGSSFSSSNLKKRRQSWTPSNKTLWIRACKQSLNGKLENSKDPDEIPHCAAFHQVGSICSYNTLLMVQPETHQYKQWTILTLFYVALSKIQLV